MTIHNYFLDRCAVLMQQSECGNGRQMMLTAEHSMKLYINNRFETRLVCSPEHLEELVVGRLCSEGWVSSPEEIISILICDNGSKATAFLGTVDLMRHSARKTDSYGFRSAGSGITEDSVAEQDTGGQQPVIWNPEWLRTMIDKMNRLAPLYAQTHAAHSSFLLRDGMILCEREDIGRHNALDKVIGWAAINRVDLSMCIAFTTGRLPLDMAKKAVIAGIPVLVSKTFPTREAVEYAKENHLTMISIRSEEEFYVWNDMQDHTATKDIDQIIRQSPEIAV